MNETPTSVPKNSKRRARRRKTATAIARQASKTGRGLTLKKERTARAYVAKANGNKSEAMRLGGYSGTTARKQQARVFGDPIMERRIEELLAEEGLTDHRVMAKHSALLDAKVTRVTPQASIEQADNDTQLRAVELYYKLTGKLKDRVEVESVARVWSERIALAVEKCACSKCRLTILDAIIGELSAQGAG